MSKIDLGTLPKKVRKSKKEDENKPPERVFVDSICRDELPGKKFLIHSGKNDVGWEGFFLTIEGIDVPEKFYRIREDIDQGIDLLVFQANLGILDLPDPEPTYTVGIRREIEHARLVEINARAKEIEEKGKKAK